MGSFGTLYSVALIYLIIPILNTRVLQYVFIPHRESPIPLLVLFQNHIDYFCTLTLPLES